MKRALRIIIPIVLCVVLVLFAAWYLLVYDQEFTRDILLTQARSFERAGNHKAAAWMYDLCYYQSSQDDNVAIELARQYVKAGNYTKAEYTLSKAISQSSSLQLYSALCSLYVEQDKLLDAVSLLDSITDDSIKQKLDAARPSTPAVSLEPGFYSQYITLALESPNAQLYVSTDGHYPSTADGIYTEPITLPGGETVIYALAVNEDNLVSSLGVFGYTIGGVIKEVSFTDAAMESAIRSILTVSDNAKLFTNDLWSVTNFTVPAEATSLDDLKYLTYLRSLTVENSDADLHALSVMTALEELNLRNCKVTADDLKSIGHLTGLKSLTMEGCSLSTIEPLSALTGLTTLDLSGNTLRNLQPISGMHSLTTLDLSSNAVVDLADLAQLDNLISLDVSNNALTSLAPLLGDKPLLLLKAAGNQLTDITGIDQLKSLGNLDLSQNLLTDIAPLGGCSMLVDLNISNNSVSDISCLYNLINLSQLNFSHNLVKELPAFVPESALVTIDGSYNQLSSLNALSGLAKLNNVYMDYNDNISTLKPLDDCPVLIQVNAYGTKVKDVSFLTEHSIIVNFNPTK